MPELPEVETVRRSLEKRIAGETVTGVDVHFAGCLETGDPEAFRAAVTGRRIASVGRRAKYLLLCLDDGGIVLVHLRMTGRLTVAPRPEDEKYLRLAFTFASGGRLFFYDLRKFGRVGWYSCEAELNERLRLGPDPTSPGFDAAALARILEGRKAPVKSLLLNQALVGGLGNIYADEALHRAGIAPVRKAGELSSREVGELCAAIRAVLGEGIQYKGTTLRDYVDGDGREGEFQERLRVYGREGKPCTRCGTPVSRVKIAGRSSFFCPVCQA